MRVVVLDDRRVVCQRWQAFICVFICSHNLRNVGFVLPCRRAIPGTSKGRQAMQAKRLELMNDGRLYDAGLVESLPESVTDALFPKVQL